MDIKLISTIAAALAVSIGSIGPALAEGRSVAAAMDAIARQPEAASALIGFLGSPEAASAISKAGLTPLLVR